MQEEEIFRELVLADTSKSLTHIFFAQRLTTKVRSLEARSTICTVRSVLFHLYCTVCIVPSVLYHLYCIVCTPNRGEKLRRSQSNVQELPKITLHVFPRCAGTAMIRHWVFGMCTVHTNTPATWILQRHSTVST